MEDKYRSLSYQEIGLLPKWAATALAARCGRQVLKLIGSLWPMAGYEHANSARRAVDFAEMCSAKGKIYIDSATINSAITSSYNEARRDNGTSIKCEMAIYSPYWAFHSAIATKREDTVYAAFNAVYGALSAAAIVFSEKNPFAIDMHNNYTSLIATAKKLSWTDDTPVPPSVFGPLEEFVDNSTAKSFLLELHSPDDTSPHDIGDAVVKLWEVASEYHMARGGGVLTFDEFQQMMPALVPVGPKLGR